MEIIKQIEEVYNVDNLYDGYKITTSEQEILLLIANCQHCCEDWGCLASNDNFEDFIGAKLREVVEVEASSLEYRDELSSIGEGDSIFINVETNKGTLQFAIYNAHNDYYEHRVMVISKQLNLDTYV